MKRTSFAMAAAVLSVALGGCLVSDQLTTLTINPDGSADLVLFRSNIRSTEKGEAGERELAAYQAQFDSQEEQDFQKIWEADGQIVASSWIRKQAPLANVLHARFDTAAALEKYGTSNGDGSLASTVRFTREGARRRLSIRLVSRLAAEDLAPAPADVARLKQQLADGVSHTRVVVANGAITNARGFTVAGDKQSALLDIDEVFAALRNQSEFELFLEWDVK